MISELVREFHEIFGHPVEDSPILFVPEELRILRHGLIAEEFEELGEAIAADDAVEAADALGDISYVTYGAAWTIGADIDEVLQVFRSSRPELVEEFSTSKNPLLSEEGRANTLQKLDEAMRDGVDDTVSMLAFIQLAVEGAAIRWMIPLDEVVRVIHESNMSKLGEDGKPMYYTDGPKKGKVMKGPNTKLPTADIRRVLGIDDAETSH